MIEIKSKGLSSSIVPSNGLKPIDAPNHQNISMFWPMGTLVVIDS